MHRAIALSESLSGLAAPQLAAVFRVSRVTSTLDEQVIADHWPQS